MKKIVAYLVLLYLLLNATAGFGQTQVSGKVTAIKARPFLSIGKYKGTNKGTITKATDPVMH